MALISAQIVSINNQATAPAPTSQPTGYSSSIVSIITETPKNTDVSSNELEENTKLIEEAKKEQEEKNNLNPLYNSQKEDNYSKIKAFADNICAMLGIKHHSAVSEDSFSYNGYDVQKVTRNGMDYVLFVPKDYDPEKEYTLAMYEHGTGEQQCENLSQFINKDQFIQGIFKQQAINVGSDESQKTALGNVIIACPLKNNTSRWDNDAKVAE